MVDVSAKAVTTREATAQAIVHISEELAAAISANRVAKGNILEIARIAGIQGAKKTAELIPLCHQLPLETVSVEIELQDRHVHIRATARATAKTGVEMEALTAASIAALTVYDMGKAIDRGMTIESVCLVAKSGGARGDYLRPTPTPTPAPTPTPTQPGGAPRGAPGAS